jgi:hypothetical protein
MQARLPASDLERSGGHRASEGSQADPHPRSLLESGKEVSTMIYKLDEESKRRIEDLGDLREHVSAIHASVQAGEDGQEEIQISISLQPTFSTSAPSVETGQILNNIAFAVRRRATELPVSAVISFSKEDEEE